MKENWRDKLGIYKEYELIHQINQAKLKRLDEIEIVQKDGNLLKIKLSNTSPEGISGSDVWGW
ncbi:MAG: hypothetical protein ABIA37_02330 [Candidatus Woesearchaeota archaeon]